MLGLRADADQFLQQAQNGNGHKKSYRFAERLNGRFFVSGISGGFEKYHKMKTGADLAPPPKKPQYNYQPVLEKAQREELRKEAEKLLELEEKLAEVRLFMVGEIQLPLHQYLIFVASTNKRSEEEARTTAPNEKTPIRICCTHSTLLEEEYSPTSRKSCQHTYHYSKGSKSASGILCCFLGS